MDVKMILRDVKIITIYIKLFNRYIYYFEFNDCISLIYHNDSKNWRLDIEDSSSKFVAFDYYLYTL